MSINGVFRTSVSGMNAQANRLSAVSDNIANSSTTGYKRAQVEFSSLVIDSGGGSSYSSGAVLSQTRNNISGQGLVSTTSSATDLAITGNGFFIVQDENGREAYTRAGSFVPKTVTGADGAQTTYLVNAAGQRLSTKDAANQTVPVTLPVGQVIAPTATTNTTLNMQLPSSSVANKSFVTSTTVYNKLGAAEEIKVIATKTGAGDITATPAESGEWTFTFEDKDGAIPPARINPAPAPVMFGADGMPLPAGAAIPAVTLTLADGTEVTNTFGSITQYDTAFSSEVTSNGNPSGFFEDFSISTDGVVSGRMDSGQNKVVANLKLASFSSPDQLTTETGNLFFATRESGAVKFGDVGAAGFGGILSGALEESNVDLADELSTMIVAQRSYGANSKVFQTGSEMLDLLINLKR
ncbi:flagellar hook protein FlgE [Fulvimarina sp. 2208YS6-2-32]|uniref:Flagellar hook protein FlgE n=1 Tax=Fulvimarina uroteuthidis TaxID=3098149 RepID=A0ABU5I3X7_9HYPH|nr:flagellar hook protein FlgE [Fulvimarina sp. 2208YS6-2-32]MDY8110075.1 flagellar hook protein FlgE [Fulvimarina sp. 2208YS6-2-32]